MDNQKRTADIMDLNDIKNEAIQKEEQRVKIPWFLCAACVELFPNRFTFQTYVGKKCCGLCEGRAAFAREEYFKLLFCDICSVKTASFHHLKMHVNGKKHRKRLKSKGIDIDLFFCSHHVNIEKGKKFLHEEYHKHQEEFFKSNTSQKSRIEAENFEKNKKVKVEEEEFNSKRIKLENAHFHKPIKNMMEEKSEIVTEYFENDKVKVEMDDHEIKLENDDQYHDMKSIKNIKEEKNDLVTEYFETDKVKVEMDDHKIKLENDIQCHDKSIKNVNVKEEKNYVLDLIDRCMDSDSDDEDKNFQPSKVVGNEEQLTRKPRRERLGKYLSYIEKAKLRNIPKKARKRILKDLSLLRSKETF